MKNIEIQFITSTGIPKGHVTLMWNRAFKQAYEENCDYFFQCGDDIKFLTIGWVDQCIEKMQQNNNLGLTGPLDYDRWMTGPNSRLAVPDSYKLKVSSVENICKFLDFIFHLKLKIGIVTIG